MRALLVIVALSLVAPGCGDLPGSSEEVETMLCGYTETANSPAVNAAESCRIVRVPNRYYVTQYDVHPCSVRDAASTCLFLEPDEPFKIWNWGNRPGQPAPELDWTAVDCSTRCY